MFFLNKSSVSKHHENDTLPGELYILPNVWLPKEPNNVHFFCLVLI